MIYIRHRHRDRAGEKDRHNNNRDGQVLGSDGSLLPSNDHIKKPKLGALFGSSIHLGRVSAIIFFMFAAYFPCRSTLKNMNQISSRPSTGQNEQPTSRHHLPSIYWINLDESEERRDALIESMEASGIVNQHRVAAYTGSEASAMLQSKELILHPQIKIYAGNGQKSFLKHPDSLYTYNEAACLLSHLKAIKQAHDSGDELVFIAEDDALFSSFFCDEFQDYIAQTPEGWKVLQFSTNSPHVVVQGSLMSEPFISWQRYHHSTRAYLINRTGMETILSKVHSTSLTGKSVWRIQEFPSVVADEAIYSLIGDTYYSTGLWVDTSELDSTIQQTNVPQGWNNPYSYLEGKKRTQVAMKKGIAHSHLLDRSLLVVMTVRINDKSQIAREVAMMKEDIHAICSFHKVCNWEVNVVATEASLVTLFEETASELPLYVHLHTKMQSKPLNKFLFVKEILDELAHFDSVLFKDNDQRLNGFPWRTFVQHIDNAVLSAPLRSTQRDHMLWSTKKKKSEDIQLYDVNHWLFWNNGRDFHRHLLGIFKHIEPVEVPFLSTYFVHMDAKFAKFFFQKRVLASDIHEFSSMHNLWCKAAFDWDSARPSCTLIPLVSTHEDTLNEIKRDSDESAIQSQGKRVETKFDGLTSLAMEWEAIVGQQHTVLEKEQHCLKRMNIPFVDEDDDVAYEGVPDMDIRDCAKTFIQEF